MAGPLFAIGEAGYQVNGLPGGRGLIGNYRAGFWYDDSQFTDFTTVARGFTPRVARGNWGVYGLFDQVLVRFGEAGNRFTTDASPGAHPGSARASTREHRDPPAPRSRRVARDTARYA